MKNSPATRRTQADRNRETVTLCRQMIFGHWIDVRKHKLTFEQHLAGSAGMWTRVNEQSAKISQADKAALHAYGDAFYQLNAWEKVYIHAHAGHAYLSFTDLPAEAQLTFSASGLSAHVWQGPEVVNGAPLASLKFWGELSR